VKWTRRSVAGWRAVDVGDSRVVRLFRIDGEVDRARELFIRTRLAERLGRFATSTRLVMFTFVTSPKRARGTTPRHR
jgi:hypothetical protein